MAFESLNAHITAEAADYNTTISRAKSRAEELADESDRVSMSMQIMQSRVDEAADENRDLAASSLLASGGLTTLATSGTRTSLSMTSLSVALTGSVIPALGAATAGALALGAAIGAVGAAVLSLVGAFGLLIGAGVVTHLEDLQQAFSDVVPRIKDALRPLGRVFGPLLEQAIRALPELVRRIVSAVGGVQQFKTALKDFGALAMQTIPPLVGAMVDFGRMVLPAIRKVVSYLKGEGGAIFKQLQATWQRISDELVIFIGAVVKALPPLIKLGGIIAEGVLPILTLLVQIIGFLAKGINGIITLGERIVNFFASKFPGSIQLAAAALSAFATSLQFIINLGIRLYNLFTKIANLMPGIDLGQVSLIGPGGGPGGGMGAASTMTAPQGTRRPQTELRASTRRRMREENGGELPPIKVVGDTEAIKSAGYEGADQRLNEERRKYKRSGNSTL